MVKSNNPPMGETSGQSLIELLVALGLAVTVMMMALGIMRFLIRLGANDPVAQTGALLARKAADSATEAAAGSWQAVANTVAGEKYHVATSTNGFTLSLGVATSTINGITYTNYVTVDSVFRSATDTISAVGTVADPTTKKITITSSWWYGGATSTEVIESYVARTRNESIVQTDWIGGPTCPSANPVLSAGATPTQFCLVTNGALDYTSVPGSLRIQGK
jgi:hypothetical protein